MEGAAVSLAARMGLFVFLLLRFFSLADEKERGEPPATMVEGRELEDAREGHVLSGPPPPPPVAADSAMSSAAVEGRSEGQ